jgi:AN1-type zinc finger protein 2
MELLDKGKHCSEEYCHQFDILPAKCKACLKIFCNEHIKYDNHKCREAYKFDYQIPTCPLCHETIEFQRGKDLNICLAEHIQNCENEESNMKKKKANKTKCSILKCKTKSNIMPFECKNCNKNFCIKHRMQEDHDCQARNELKLNSNFKTCGQQHNAFNNTQIKNNFFSAKTY